MRGYEPLFPENSSKVLSCFKSPICSAFLRYSGIFTLKFIQNLTILGSFQIVHEKLNNYLYSGIFTWKCIQNSSIHVEFIPKLNLIFVYSGVYTLKLIQNTPNHEVSIQKTYVNFLEFNSKCIPNSSIHENSLPKIHIIFQYSSKIHPFICMKSSSRIAFNFISHFAKFIRKHHKFSWRFEFGAAPTHPNLILSAVIAIGSRPNRQMLSSACQFVCGQGIFLFCLARLAGTHFLCHRLKLKFSPNGQSARRVAFRGDPKAYRQQNAAAYPLNYSSY